MWRAHVEAKTVCKKKISLAFKKNSGEGRSNPLLVSKWATVNYGWMHVWNDAREVEGGWWP